MEIPRHLRDGVSLVMKHLLFCCVLTLAGAAFADGGSAYSALRAAQQTGSLGDLVEVEGDRGEPRPQTWKLLFKDSTARGGVREVEVSGGVVVAQRTPLRGSSGVAAMQPIALPQLNLDSDAVFDIANRQAAANKLGFSWVDYSLRSHSVTGAPLWALKLYDNMGANVGRMSVSAVDGSIVVPLGGVAQPRSDESTSTFGDTPAGQRVGGVVNSVTGAVERTAKGVSNAAMRGVGTVQEVFTGERTVGPKDEDQ